MATVSPIAAPVHRGPPEALRSWLCDHHYTAHSVAAIVAHAAEEGTPTGAPELDPEDEGPASEVYVGAMDPVSRCSNEWDDPSIYLDVETLLAGGLVVVPVEALVPPELDPEPCPPSEEDEAAYLAWEAAALPPIAGGAPDAAGPTEADWAEYRAWADRQDRLEASRGDLPDAPRFGYE